MMSRKTPEPRKPSRDLAFEQAQTGMSTRAVRFRAAALPSVGTPQHAALVSDLRRAFPEIYSPADGTETTG